LNSEEHKKFSKRKRNVTVPSENIILLRKSGIEEVVMESLSYINNHIS
jgi:hypothetical protein